LEARAVELMKELRDMTVQRAAGVVLELRDAGEELVMEGGDEDAATFASADAASVAEPSAAGSDADAAPADAGPAETVPQARGQAPQARGEAPQARGEAPGSVHGDHAVGFIGTDWRVDISALANMRLGSLEVRRVSLIVSGPEDAVRRVWAKLHYKFLRGGA
jgi:hypothetical protein